jgi:ketosteroid isomerase-like protein
MDETSRKRLICPHCKIIYERGSSCIRCGTALATQTSSQEEEKPEPLEMVEVKKEELEVAPTSAKEIKEEHPQTQIPEEEATKKKGEEFERRLSLSGKGKRDYRRLFREAGGITIMVVAGGYFLWAIYSHLVTRPSKPKTVAPKEVITQILPGSSASTTPALPVAETKENLSPSKEITAVTPPPSSSNLTPSDHAAAETVEIGKIRDLLEKIRQANLRKDIDLFLSCYASDFKDREGKKKATLAHWKNFDYIDLSYDLKNPSILANTAKARVEWLIKISPYTGGQPRESKTILDVILRKEGGAWKIEEVKSIG